MKGTISVAICTCDAGGFLPELLESVRNQARAPDEWVICDDASNDDSFAVISEFSRSLNVPVRVVRNRHRLGVVKNFEKALQLCSGEFIALGDQDDVWMPGKLAALEAALEGAPDASAAFSDAAIVNQALQSLGYTMWDAVGFSPSRRKLLVQDKPWDVLHKSPVVTGATMMFRRSILNWALPLPESWVHDAWLAQIAAVQGHLIALNDSLVMYRQHPSNLIGGVKLPVLDQIRAASLLGRSHLVRREIRRFKYLHERLLMMDESPRRKIILDKTAKKLTHLRRRLSLPDNRLRRLVPVAAEWLNGNYQRFSKDWKVPAVDLFLP